MFSSTSSRKHLLLAACALVSTVATACLDPIIVGGTDSTGGAGGTGGNGGTGGTGTPAGYDGVSFSAEGHPYGGSPGSILLELGPEPLTCGDPFDMGDGCATTWHLSVELGPSRQAAGVYALPDPEIGLDFVSQGSSPDGSSCYAQNGFLEEGTLEVAGSAASGFTLIFDGVPEAVLNDTFTFFHCSPAGPTGSVGAVAMYASQFPNNNGGGSSSAASTTATTTTTTGGGVDNDTLHLNFGNHGPTCSAPFSFNEDCTVAEWHVGVALPLAYQTPGIYDLSDPNLNSFASEQFAGDDPGLCSGGGGSFTDGTIEVVSILPNELLVRFNGVSAHAAELQQDIRVPRCE